jgi:hypothetical protein
MNHHTSWTALKAKKNRARIAEWADFVYLRSGRVTHVLPFALVAYSYSRIDSGEALCGRTPGLWGEWFGTGGQREADKAASMPLCLRCEEQSEGRTR